MGIPDSGVGDHTDLWSEATRLWNEVIRFVLETGLKSARLAETVGSLGDRAGARQLAAYGRKSQRHVLRYSSSAHLSHQEEQAIRRSLEQIDEALKALPPTTLPDETVWLVPCGSGVPLAKNQVAPRFTRVSTCLIVSSLLV
jgi:hypothetical protein